MEKQMSEVESISRREGISPESIKTSLEMLEDISSKISEYIKLHKEILEDPSKSVELKEGLISLIGFPGAESSKVDMMVCCNGSKRLVKAVFRFLISSFPKHFEELQREIEVSEMIKEISQNIFSEGN